MCVHSSGHVCNYLCLLTKSKDDVSSSFMHYFYHFYKVGSIIKSRVRICTSEFDQPEKYFEIRSSNSAFNSILFISKWTRKEAQIGTSRKWHKETFVFVGHLSQRQSKFEQHVSAKLFELTELSIKQVATMNQSCTYRTRQVFHTFEYTYFPGFSLRQFR